MSAEASTGIGRGWADGARGALVSRRRDEIWLWIAAALGARVAFWLITDRVFEDALITLAHVRNLVAGLGLTHHPGEPVTFGFTSALSVLVPLVGEIVSAGSGLVVLRIVSLVAAAVAILAAADWCASFGLPPWARRVAFAYLAFDPLQVLYGMSGMETQIAVATLLVSAALLVRRPLRPAWIGVSLGVALLARPDLLLWVGAALAFLLARHRRAATVAGAVTVATVAPWLVFTALYYGSPIPQTIVAKAASLTQPFGDSIVAWAAEQAGSHAFPLLRMLMPFYEDSMVASAPVAAVWCLGVGLALWALVIVGLGSVWRRSPAVPMFVAAFVAYRVLALPSVYFDWYLVPFNALAMLIAVIGLERVLGSRPARLAPVALVLALAVSLPLLWVTQLQRRVQLEVEAGNRVPLARYLGRVVPVGVPIGTEAAGYVGYYSGDTIYDYPGLTSRATLAALLSLPRSDRTFAGMIVALQPPWIVVRPQEEALLQQRDPGLAARYALCATFDSGTGDTLGWGGLTVHTEDDVFQVRALDGCPPGSVP